MLGEILNAGINYFNNKKQVETARYNTDATNRANRELAEYTFSKNYEMWKENNQYNSPEAQMQRFQNAGLNPNLMYSKGQPGLSASMPTFQQPQQSYNYKARQIPTLGEAADLRMKNAQTALLDAQAKKIESETTGSSLDNQRKQIENTFALKKNEFANEKLYYEYQNEAVKNYIQHIELERKQTGLDNASTEYKFLFQKMKTENWSDQRIIDALAGVAITKEIANALSKVGFGALAAKLLKK